MVTIREILEKQKALELLTLVNGYKRNINANTLSAHTNGGYGRDKRSTAINKIINFLYKETQIKTFFPKITKAELKEAIVNFTRQNIERIDRKKVRITDLELRRCRRLLPLSQEKYKELEKRSDVWDELVQAVTQIQWNGYYSSYRPVYIKELTYQTLFRTDEKPHKKLSERERKYA
jgi:hypothetical protein